MVERVITPPDIVQKVLDRKPELPSTQPIERVEVNTYKGRSLVEITVGGQKQEWFSVKGGVSESKEFRSHDTPSYEIFYNPQTHSWMKTLPILTADQKATIPNHLEQLDLQLRLSVDMQRKAMELAGVGHLAHPLRLDTIALPDGTQQIAFVSPHLGDSLEYGFIQSLPNKKKPERIKYSTLRDDVKAWARNIYHVVFQDAVALYLRYDYWTEDPNPGNILFHRRGEGDTAENFPFLIDFANRRQHIDIPTKKPNESTIDYRDRLRKHYITHLEQLTEVFRKTCDAWHIPFKVDEETRNNIDAYIDRLVESV